MKVSFDFDNTLTLKSVQAFAKKLVDLNYEVWIVTSRMGKDKSPTPTWNDDLYKVAKEVGIRKEQIHFCCGENKADFIKQRHFRFHLDDDPIELSFIRTDTDCVGVLRHIEVPYISLCMSVIKGHIF